MDRELRVLVVDDDDSVCRALARSLRRAGYAVETFRSVGALLARGVPEDNACLVLDVNMPGVSGTAFKRALVDAGRDLPTVFITALEPNTVSESLAALSPLAVLYKPFDDQDLLDAIGRARA